MLQLILQLSSIVRTQWRSQGGAHWGTCPTNFILCPTKFFLVNLQITTITLFKQIVNYIPNIPKPSMILHQSIWSLNGRLLDHKFRWCILIVWNIPSNCGLKFVANRLVRILLTMLATIYLRIQVSIYLDYISIIFI